MSPALALREGSIIVSYQRLCSFIHVFLIPCTLPIINTPYLDLQYHRHVFIPRDSSLLCDDSMHLIPQKTNSNPSASGNAKLCTILRIPRQCSHSSGVVCSLVPICCSLIISGGLIITFICRPNSLQVYIAPNRRPPLSPRSTIEGLRTEENFREEKHNKTYLLSLLSHPLSGGPGSVGSFLWSPQSAALFSEPVSVPMRVWFLLNLPPCE